MAISHPAERGVAPVWLVVGAGHLVYLQAQVPRRFCIRKSSAEGHTSIYLLSLRAGANVLLVPSLGSFSEHPVLNAAWHPRQQAGCCHLVEKRGYSLAGLGLKQPCEMKGTFENSFQVRGFHTSVAVEPFL